jgi:hypothetical protein
MAISVALPPSGTIGENPDDYLSLSSSYHNDLPSPKAAMPPHGHESTMDRESVVIRWSIDLIYDFFYKKQLREILENAKITRKSLDFLVNTKITPTFIKLALNFIIISF